MLQFNSQCHTSLLRKLKSSKLPKTFDTGTSFPHPQIRNLMKIFQMFWRLNFQAGEQRHEFFFKMSFSHFVHKLFQENHSVIIVLRIFLRHDDGRTAYLSFKAHNLFWIQYRYVSLNDEDTF